MLHAIMTVSMLILAIACLYHGHHNLETDGVGSWGGWGMCLELLIRGILSKLAGCLLTLFASCMFGRLCYM